MNKMDIAIFKDKLLIALYCSGLLLISSGFLSAENGNLPGESEEINPSSLSLSFVGDIMAHDVILNRPPYSSIYTHVESLFKKDDLTFGNLEFPIDPDKPPSGYPLFNVHKNFVDAAVAAGFDVFSLANNHVADQGNSSVLNSHKTMSQIPQIFFSGIREIGKMQMKPLLIEKKGWRIGFLAITSFSNNKTETEHLNLVNYRDPGTRKAFIAQVEEYSSEYDLFILSIHDGIEYASEPNEVKMAFFRDLVKAGTNIIWGHHPHVVQPWETVRVEGREALILASCGNFISGQTWFLDPDNPNNRAPTGDSVIFQVTIEKSSGTSGVRGVSPLYISNYRDPQKGMIVNFTEKLMLSDEIPEKWRIYYNSRFSIISNLLKPAYAE